MRHLFDAPLGVQAPLGVPKNVIGTASALLIGAGISAAASTAGTMYNNYQANLANDKAWERQKELQNIQFNQQKEMYEHQFKRETEYNDPSHMRELYEGAGYNPQVLAHSQDLGAASSHSGIPSVPSAPPVAQRQTFPMDLGSSVGGISQALAVGSEIKRNDAEAFSKIVESIPQIGKALGWKDARQVAQDMLGLYGVSGSQYERLLDQQIKAYELQNYYQELQNDIADVFAFDDARQINANLKTLGQKLYQEAQKIISDMSVNASNVKLNDAQIAEINKRITTYASQIAKNFAEANHLNMSADQIRQLTPYLVKSANMQAEMDAYDKKEMETDFVQGEWAREWQRSDEGKSAASALQAVDDNGETSLVNKIISGRNSQRAKYGRRRK